MDIYKLVEENDMYQYADYLDMHTGYIFKTKEYCQRIKSGNINAKIAVYDTEGDFVGYAEKK